MAGKNITIVISIKFFIQSVFTHSTQCFFTKAYKPTISVYTSTTTITNVVVHDDAEVIYDLCGRKLDKMPKSGVVIKNNKKIYIK